MAYFDGGRARLAAEASSRVHVVHRVNQVAGLRLQLRVLVFQVQATRAPTSFRRDKSPRLALHFHPELRVAAFTLVPAHVCIMPFLCAAPSARVHYPDGTACT